MKPRMRLLLTLAAALSPAGCKEPAEPAPQPSVARAPIASAPPSASAPARPWFIGTWTGRFRAEPHAVGLDRKQGAPREWVEAKSPRCAGEVSLSVAVDDAGVVTGSASGALGNVAVQGSMDGDALKARLTPMGQDAFHGTLLVTRKEGALVGELRASSDDSLELCKASVSLRK